MLNKLTIISVFVFILLFSMAIILALNTKAQTNCSSLASLSVSTDKASYKEGETITGSIVLTNNIGVQAQVSFTGKIYKDNNLIYENTIATLTNPGANNYKLSDLFTGGILTIPPNTQGNFKIEVLASAGECELEAEDEFEIVKDDAKFKYPAIDVHMHCVSETPCDVAGWENLSEQFNIESGYLLSGEALASILKVFKIHIGEAEFNGREQNRIVKETAQKSKKLFFLPSLSQCEAKNKHRDADWVEKCRIEIDNLLSHPKSKGIKGWWSAHPYNLDHTVVGEWNQLNGYCALEDPADCLKDPNSVWPLLDIKFRNWIAYLTEVKGKPLLSHAGIESSYPNYEEYPYHFDCYNPLNSQVDDCVFTTGEQLVDFGENALRYKINKNKIIWAHGGLVYDIDTLKEVDLLERILSTGVNIDTSIAFQPQTQIEGCYLRNLFNKYKHQILFATDGVINDILPFRKGILDQIKLLEGEIYEGGLNLDCTSANCGCEGTQFNSPIDGDTLYLIERGNALCVFEDDCGSALPPTKKGDLNSDGKVDVIDLGIFLSNWGKTTKPSSDINQDGKVDVIDLGILLSNWG